MEPLVLLAVLACPIGMGLMMWFMGKGMMGGSKKEDDSSGEVEQLRAEQERLSSELERLERRRAGEQDLAPR